MTLNDLVNAIDYMSVPDIYRAMTTINDGILREHGRVMTDLVSIHRGDAPMDCYDSKTRECYLQIWAANTAIMHAMAPSMLREYVRYCQRPANCFPATYNYR